MSTCIIELDQSSFDCLSDNVPDDSLLGCVFEPQKNDGESGYLGLRPNGRGMPLRQFQVYCSKEECKELLIIAQAHCTDAVYSIERALALADKAI